MDPSNTPLGKLLLDEITPVVMVLRTTLVEEACSKNGLSFVQMLTPFCSFNNIDVPVRTASDQPYRLQKFKLRLFYASDIRQRDFQVSKERLKEVVVRSGDYDLSSEESDLTQIDDLLSRPDSEILPSWFKLFNEELIRVPSFSEHEAFDHPVACLMVVSSKDEHPINKFVDFFNTGQLPWLFNDGAMDPKVLKLYLLVHDKQDGAPENAMRILGEMKSTFGANVSQLLCINSSDNGIVEKSGHPWESFKNEASQAQQLGSLLTEEDLNEIEDLAHNLASKYIIPYMEEKVRVLNQQVSATRKGFRNQIKNLWWRKAKEETPDASNGPMYTFSSTESQIRVLGDYAFMLCDYELALSNYRLISTDYKIDKAWRRYAGVQEMMGLTYFLLDQSKKEAEYCMENAFSTYLKIGSAGYPNATRCGLWWVEMLKTRDQFKEAAGVYFRIPGEEPLHSAVMLEQASYCYLFSVPPMTRKYGFHLVLSGNQYKNCDQIKHAIRTYRRAMSVFKGTTWSYIKDHVHFNVGQWYSFLGLYDVAVTHMLEVLTCGYQSKTMQELYLKNFLQIVQKTGKALEMLRLPLPVVNPSSFRVIFEDHRTYASSATVGVRESMWQSLEEEIIPSLPTARTNWLELQSTFISRKHTESNLCVVGEAIKVDIELKNPLQIAIPIFNVSLMCLLSAKSDEMESGSTDLSGDEEIKLEAAMVKTSDVSSFTLSEVDFTLEGGGTAMVQLTVTPMVEGILKIIGIKWKLSDSVVGYHNFPTSTPKKTAKGRRKKKYFPTDSLKFMVIKSIPKLEGFLHSMPGKTYAGELRHLVLELNSNSEMPVKNMKMKVSHPRYVCVGSQQSLDMDFPGCMEKKTNAGQPETEDQPKQESDSVFVFPEDSVARSGTSFLWPLWLHAAVPGSVDLYIILYYEIEDSESIIKYRTLRMLHHLEVLPSLDVSFQINPYPSSLQQFLVRMDVTNKTNAEGVSVQQLTSVGNNWEISLLQPVDIVLPSPPLMPGQAFSCFLLLKKREKSENNENRAPIGSDVKYSTVELNEPIYDISLSPLVDFHCCERLHQGKLSQDDASTVDFILISLPMSSRTLPGFSDRPCFSSHHICHSSVRSMSPISWQVDGPCNIHHDFSTSFCEVTLSMILYNCSEAAATVHINTVDSVHNTGQSDDAKTVPSGDKAGWYNVSLDNDIKVISNVSGNRIKSLSSDSVSAVIWSGSSTTKVHLAPSSTATIPLQICVFSPGTYDLSNYSLHWSILEPDDQESEEKRVSSGNCVGYPYYLTVLQCTSS